MPINSVLAGIVKEIFVATSHALANVQTALVEPVMIIRINVIPATLVLLPVISPV